jgi:hypothetical protein
VGIQIAGFTVANLAEVDSYTSLGGVAVSNPRALHAILYDARGLVSPQGFDQNSAADRETFGAAVAHQRATMISADFALPFASNAIALTTTNGGTTAQSNGSGTLVTGANVSGTSKAVSYQAIKYQPGREIYCVFTAAFTTPTSANSNQRAGLYDTNNGFFLGYQGVSFGITKRNLAADSFVAQAAFNVDTLLGTAGSTFTSLGVVVAIDPTKLNVYRIRFGWLGGATITYQVMAPDGNWVTFHRILGPNVSTTPTIANPNLPITMEVLKAAADATSLTLFTSSWDAGVVSSNANPNTGAVLSGAIAGTPIMGIDGGQIVRVARVGEYGTQRTTTEQQLWQDAFEGATINVFWTQSLTTMTAVQATGVLTLNNASITTLNTDAIITSQRQFPKYPRQPLFCRFRGLITANAAANHTLVEMGFGTAAGVTAAVTNGTFFRWTAAGNLVGVVSYGATETVSATLVAQGDAKFIVTNYYYYDVIIDDDFARFIVSDANGTPIVDMQMAIATTSPYTFSTSHVPTFARVYVDAVGGGTAIQLKLAAHVVQMIDGLNNMSWAEQTALSLREANINPTAYTQTAQLAAGAAPAAFTPSNTVGGNALLGGEALCNATATSENLLSVFAFVIPTPYTFLLDSIYVGVPLNTVVAVATTAIVHEWFLIANCATGNISTGGGQRRTIPNATFTAAVALVANGLFTGQAAFWNLKTPIPCLPGTTLHIGYKVILGTATATEVFRQNVGVGGKYI